MRDTTTEIVDDLADHADATLKPKEGEPATPTLPVLSREDLHPAWQVDFPVLCIASRSPLDEAAAMMLAQLLKNHGVSARVSAIRARGLGESAQGIDAPDAPLVCLSYFGAVGNPAHVRFLILVEPPDDLTLPHVGSSSATPRPPETNLAVEVVAGHSARGI